MRVISGKAKGHKLETVEGLIARPTTDRIKETLFNIISPDLEGCTFLDLFSGSGAIGIEALSRGAKNAVFVENNKNCAEIIKKNLEFTKLEEYALVLKQDVIQAISSLTSLNKSFDIIFLDPPYESEFVEPVLWEVVKKGILKKDGYVIVERSSKTFPPNVFGLKIKKEKSYKTTIMTFLTLEE